MDVSIILVSYNTKDLTINCLKSVYEKTKELDFEIIVVDNNSQDGSVEMLEEEFPNIKLIKNKENKGFGSANNIAIKQAEGKYIFLLNTDTILDNNAIKIFFDFMEKEENQNAGACGGNLYDENSNRIHSSGKLPSIKRIAFTSIGLNLIFKNFYKKTFCTDDAKEVNKVTKTGFITGADLFLRKSVIDKTGSFDEDFFMYYEDSELQYRIQKSGYLIYIVPNARIYHLTKTPKTSTIDLVKKLRKNEYLYFKKTGGYFAYIAVKILYTIRAFLDIKFSKEYFEKILICLEIL